MPKKERRVRFTLVLDKEQMDYLKKFAEDSRVSVAQIARELLYDAIESENKINRSTLN